MLFNDLIQTFKYMSEKFIAFLALGRLTKQLRLSYLICQLHRNIFQELNMRGLFSLLFFGIYDLVDIKVI